MYCGECGTKAQKGDAFCSNCGAKLDTNELQKKEVSKPQRKPMSKKTKVIIAGVLFALVIVGGFIGVGSSLSSPKHVAKKYVDALVSQDADDLYEYLELGKDKTFTSKKIFEELLDEEEDSLEIENYQITKVEYGDGKLTAKVTVRYTMEDSSTEQTTTVSLTKGKNKKWLFFDDWKIVFPGSSNMVIDNFEITVPKGAKVKYAGVIVNNNYLDKEKSNEQLDVYVLSQVFTVKTKIEVTLLNGYVIKDNVTPSSYKNHYTAQVSLTTIEKEEQNKIANSIKNDLSIVYQHAIERKSFDELKKNLVIAQGTEKELEETYNELVADLKEAYSTLTAIEFTNITLTTVKLDDDGYLEFRAKVNYKYTIKYKDFSGKETSKDSSSYSYMTIAYSVDKDKNYALVDMDDLEDYFSRY